MHSHTSIAALFDPTAFRETGHALIDLLADYLAGSLAGRQALMQWCPPADAAKQWQAALPLEPTLDAQGLLVQLREQILPASLAIHHPRNMGHQVASPLPLAALCDLVAALTNQAMAVYETGPSATMIEQQCIRWLTELVGWQQADGVLTSGGAQANLTALLAARKHAADVWENGITSHKPMRILVSEHAHYSVSRAAGIMGLGTNAVIKVATDTQGRMRLHALQQAHEQATQSGHHVMAVVATAGCTPTGSIDPLQEIGQYCRQQGVWLHVDGAHGASALLSVRHKEKLRGIELADSVIWDGHKLLYMPAPVSAVLFREPAASYGAFAQDASYLFQGRDAEAEQYNISYRTLECTKRMMGLKLWAAFSLYGTSKLGELVDSTFNNAQQLANKLSVLPDFELLMQPQTNILCFRHLSAGLNSNALSQHQASIRQRLVHSGQFHLTQVTLDGDIWLRTTLMNPLTQEEDMDALIAAIRTGE